MAISVISSVMVVRSSIPWMFLWNGSKLNLQSSRTLFFLSCFSRVYPLPQGKRGSIPCRNGAERVGRVKSPSWVLWIPPRKLSSFPPHSARCLLVFNAYQIATSQFLSRKSDLQELFVSRNWMVCLVQRHGESSRRETKSQSTLPLKGCWNSQCNHLHHFHHTEPFTTRDFSSISESSWLKIYQKTNI